jgi:hypothetical protein
VLFSYPLRVSSAGITAVLEALFENIKARWLASGTGTNAGSFLSYCLCKASATELAPLEFHRMHYRGSRHREVVARFAG